MLTRLAQIAKQFLDRYRHKLYLHGNNFPPLLNETELQQLQKHAAATHSEDLIAMREIQQPLLGEKDSSFSGSGYEFAEHRQYVSGDPVRHINWRVYARTGQLVRKVFHEQRRPQLYLVVDRRAAMRFGTRTRLKVTAAVMRALTHLYQAHSLQIQIGAFILDDQLHYYPAQQSEHALQPLIEHLVSPCPPVPETTRTTNNKSLLGESLDLLAVQLSAGNLVFMYSDFIDYQTSMDNQLHALGNQHTVIANHILDISETDLPPRGHYLIQQGNSSDTVNLNCADNNQRETQQQQLHVHFDRIKHAMQTAHITYRRLTASDELVKPLKPNDAIKSETRGQRYG